MIQDFREQIVSGQTDFATLAKAESHCSSASRGGDLGEFGPGQMQAAFEDVSAWQLLCRLVMFGASSSEAWGTRRMWSLTGWSLLLQATYALKVGELSEPVFSDSGVHLILRTA